VSFVYHTHKCLRVHGRVHDCILMCALCDMSSLCLRVRRCVCVHACVLMCATMRVLHVCVRVVVCVCVCALCDMSPLCLRVRRCVCVHVGENTPNVHSAVCSRKDSLHTPLTELHGTSNFF
jgi:hypothetical protein